MLGAYIWQISFWLMGYLLSFICEDEVASLVLV